MFSYPILVLSFLAVIALCIRALRVTSGTSLLAWYALAFILLFEPAAFFSEQILGGLISPNASSRWATDFDTDVAERIILSLVLVNIVLIAYLLLIRREVTQPEAANHVYVKSSEAPLIYWLGVIFVAVGIINFINSPATEMVFSQGAANLGNFDDYYYVRSEAGLAEISGISSYINLLSLDIVLPILTLYSLQKFALEGKKEWRSKWLVLLVIWTIVSILMFDKAPIVRVVLSNSVAGYFFLRAKGSRKKLIWVMGTPILTLLMMGLTFRITSGTNSLSGAVADLFERSLIIPFRATWIHFVIFPERHPFTNFALSRTLNLLLTGGEDGTSTMPPFHIASLFVYGNAYNMNTGFLAAGWAEFGYTGVVECAVVIFGILLFWDQYFKQNRSTMPIFVLTSYFLGRLWIIQNNDLMFMLVPGGIILAPLFYLLLCRKELKVARQAGAQSFDRQKHYGDVNRTGLTPVR